MVKNFYGFRGSFINRKIFSVKFFGMALLSYFKFKDKKARDKVSDMPLSDPQGQLSKEINSATIKELNKEVESLVNSRAMGKRSRLPYLKVTAEQKATLGKYAAEHGIINAIRHFHLIFLKVHLRKARSVGGKKRHNII